VFKIHDHLDQGPLEDLWGTAVYKWNRTSQDWSISVLDDLYGGWYPPMTVSPGDAVYIRYSDGDWCSTPSSEYDRIVHQVGTMVSSTNINITVKSGWNLLPGGAGDFDSSLTVPSYYGFTIYLLTEVRPQGCRDIRIPSGDPYPEWFCKYYFLGMQSVLVDGQWVVRQAWQAEQNNGTTWTHHGSPPLYWGLAYWIEADSAFSATLKLFTE
jgi:hypothetical protein